MTRHVNLDSLRRELGVVAQYLAEEFVTEVYRNPDGKLWVVRLGQPKECVGTFPEEQTDCMLRYCANALGKVLNEKNPELKGKLPLDGSRLQAEIPPLADGGRTFNLRKRASKVFTLQQYVDTGVLTTAQMHAIEQAVLERQNFVVAGPTGSGKTTLANAILDAIGRLTPHHRVAVIEDTQELQVNVPDQFGYVTDDEIGYDIQRCLKVCMRKSPERIVVGEVRDKAAQGMLDAWATGHPGGVATVHSDNAYATLSRIARLAAQSGVPTDPYLIAAGVNIIAYIRPDPERGRVLQELIRVVGYDEKTGQYITEPLVVTPKPQLVA